jgi:hypothetical protein
LFAALVWVRPDFADIPTLKPIFQRPTLNFRHSLLFGDRWHRFYGKISQVDFARWRLLMVLTENAASSFEAFSNEGRTRT